MISKHLTYPSTNKMSGPMTIKLPKRLQLPIKEQLDLFIKNYYDGMTSEDLFNFVHYYLTKEYQKWIDKSMAELDAELNGIPNH